MLSLKKYAFFNLNRSYLHFIFIPVFIFMHIFPEYVLQYNIPHKFHKILGLFFSYFFLSDHILFDVFTLVAYVVLIAFALAIHNQILLKIYRRLSLTVFYFQSKLLSFIALLFSSNTLSRCRYFLYF